MTTGARVVLRVVSALVGLLIVAGSFLGAEEIITRLLGAEGFLTPVEGWYRNLRSRPWNDDSVMYAGLVLLVAGLLLLVVASAARVRVIELRQPTESIDVYISPRAVAQMLRRQAEAVPGVATASSAVTRDSARVTVTAPLAHPDRIVQALERDLQHALKQIPWRSLPSLQVEVASARGTATRRRGASSVAPRGTAVEVDVR